MKHKVKTINGLAKILGKTKFLDIAGYFTCHTKQTVADTIYEMTSRWYDHMGGILESDKMLQEYNLGYFN